MLCSHISATVVVFRSLPNLQELLLMENKHKFVNFSSFHVGHYGKQIRHITNCMHIGECMTLGVYFVSP